MLARQTAEVNRAPYLRGRNLTVTVTLSVAFLPESGWWSELSVDGESEDFDGGAVEGLEEGVVGRLAVVEDAGKEEGGLLDRNGEMEERRDLDEDIAEGREERVTTHVPASGDFAALDYPSKKTSLILY